LEDLFSTISQFQPLLASKQLEMRELVNEFRSVVNDLKKKRHDLMAYENAQFDRDYLEFSVRYSELLDQIQHFVNRSFSETLNVRDGLDLLKRFSWMQSIERLQGDLNSKVAVIFQQYGVELDEVEKLYERHKKAPPLARNLPPVAGHIAWSRQLLERIESPMIIFRENTELLRTKEAKRIVRKCKTETKSMLMVVGCWLSCCLVCLIFDVNVACQIFTLH
jgi:dynein heavy chain